MARTNPNQSELPKNPATMFAQWKDPGLFLYWDKEQEKNIELPSNFTFIVLDELSTIKGWNDPTSSGIYANEIRNIRSETLTVKSFKGGLIAEGTYGNIHDTIVASGGKYCASVYIAYKDAEGFKIGNIQFTGSSLGAWFEFRKENKIDLYSKAVQLTGKTEAKKGATKYYVPVFKLIDVSQETDDIAGKLQEELKAYHKEYFSKTIPVELEKELDNAKSEVEQQKEIMDKHFAQNIPDDAYVSKKDDGHLVSATTPENDEVPF